jgi:hypothetical protein
VSGGGDNVSQSQAWAIVLLAVCVLVLMALDWLRAGQLRLVEEDLIGLRGRELELRKRIDELTAPAPRVKPPPRVVKGKDGAA